MKLRSGNKNCRKKPSIVLSTSGLVVIISCTYAGFKISGIGGAAVGAFVGMTICAC